MRGDGHHHQRGRFADKCGNRTSLPPSASRSCRVPYLRCPNCRLCLFTVATFKGNEKCPRCSSGLGPQGRRFVQGDLPRQAVAATPTAPTRPQGEGAVLVVDDERSIRELIRRLLSEHGYEVLVNETPEEALRVFARRPGTIDLLLTDVVMPGASGRDLAERLRQLKLDLPVVYMSGDPAGIIEPGEALPPGMSFLAKPFLPQQLFAAIREPLAAQRASARPTASR